MKGILLSVFSMVKGKERRKEICMLQFQVVVLVLKVSLFQSLLALVERKEKPGRWLACVLMKAIT